MTQGFQKGHKDFAHNKGRKRTKEVKNKYKLIMINRWKDKNYKQAMIEKHKGKKPTLKTRIKMRLSHIREKCHFWKDGRSQNKDYVSWSKNKRNRIKRNAEGSLTFGEWENLKAQYNWTCPACGRKEPKIKLTEDHIIPLSKGGSDNIENIQPLCQSCNSKKHTKIIKY